MIRKMIVLVAIFLCANIAAFAQSESDFNVTLTSDGSGVCITGYTGTARAVKIPSEIQGMPVREIGTGAFSIEHSTGGGYVTRGNTKTSITSVVIPQEVTAINARAFSCQKGLISVTLPPTVSEIGDHAFYSIDITEITLPASLTKAGKSIFDQCTNLINVRI